MTKILVSRGYGAGWSTWSDKSKEVAEYKPIIDFIEAGGDPDDLNNSPFSKDDNHPLVIQMMKDLGLDSFYSGGADGLYVTEVTGPYSIEEYDGFESVRTSENFW